MKEAVIETGRHFDPGLCRRFLKCRPRIEALYDSYHN